MTGPERPRLPRAFVVFWTAETVSAVGGAVTQIALQVLVVVELSGGATEVGLLNAVRWLPYLLLGLVVGALVDRWRRKPVLVGTDLARALVLAGIPVLWLLGGLSLPSLLGLIAVFGVLSLVNDAASQSILPRLVPQRSLLRANARLDQAGTVTQTAGPVAGGGLIGLVGAPVAVLVDAATYLVSAVLTATIRIVEPAPRQARLSLRRLVGDIAEGLRWAYRHRELAPLSVSTHAWFLCNAVLTTVAVPFALTRLGLGAFELGLAMGAAGIGGVVGALVAERLGVSLGAGPAVIACRVLTPVAVLLMVAAPDGRPGVALLLLAVGQLVYGLELGASNANEMGFRQAVTPDELQGRVNTSIRSINRAALVVGAPLAGLLADGIGYRPTLLLAAGGFALAAIGLWMSPFRAARHTE